MKRFGEKLNGFSANVLQLVKESDEKNVALCMENSAGGRRENVHGEW